MRAIRASTLTSCLTGGDVPTAAAALALAASRETALLLDGDADAEIAVEVRSAADDKAFFRDDDDDGTRMGTEAVAAPEAAVAVVTVARGAGVVGTNAIAAFTRLAANTDDDKCDAAVG